MNKLVPIVLVAVLTSCGGNEEVIKSKSGDVTSSIEAGSLSEKELQKSLEEYEKMEKERLEKEKASQTTLEFDKLRHDFGNVTTGSNNSTYFKVTNTGDKPLIIEDVAASCGCTTPMKPEQPILPGKTDLIEVSFKPNPGQLNEIIKTVTVTANTEEKIHVLEIRAFVK